MNSKYDNPTLYKDAQEKRDQLEEEYRLAGEKLLEAEKQYLSILKTFNEIQKKYDLQASIVKSYYNDLLYTTQRILKR